MSPMTPNDLLTELTYAQVTHRPVLLTGDALALVLRLARDEVAREDDVDALADTGAREEDDRGRY